MLLRSVTAGPEGISDCRFRNLWPAILGLRQRICFILVNTRSHQGLNVPTDVFPSLVDK